MADRSDVAGRERRSPSKDRRSCDAAFPCTTKVIRAPGGPGRRRRASGRRTMAHVSSPESSLRATRRPRDRTRGSPRGFPQPGLHPGRAARACPVPPSELPSERVSHSETGWKACVTTGRTEGTGTTRQRSRSATRSRTESTPSWRTPKPANSATGTQRHDRLQRRLGLGVGHGARSGTGDDRRGRLIYRASTHRSPASGSGRAAVSCHGVASTFRGPRRSYLQAVVLGAASCVADRRRRQTVGCPDRRQRTRAAWKAAAQNRLATQSTNSVHRAATTQAIIDNQLRPQRSAAGQVIGTATARAPRRGAEWQASSAA